MLVMDIGGTLLSDNNEITSENIEAINYAKGKGVKIVLATARMFSSTKYITNSTKADYAIFGNGSHIMSLCNKKSLQKKVISKEILEIILDYAKNNNLYIHFSSEFKEVSDKEDYFAKKHIIINKTKKDEEKNNIEVVPDLYDYIEKNKVIKAILVSESPMDLYIGELQFLLKNKKVFLNEHYKNLKEHTIDKIINYVEYGSEDVSKKTGIDFLIRKLKIEREEIMAIGDLENDLDMLSSVGLPIAMQNAKEIVKEKVKYVTINDNNNSGVAEAIYKFIY
jgi:Cof subfamily protein (haloacid dehalogenase superfamily)